MLLSFLARTSTLRIVRVGWRLRERALSCVVRRYFRVRLMTNFTIMSARIRIFGGALALSTHTHQTYGDDEEDARKLRSSGS